MDRDITVEMLAFNLKMLSKRSKKSILISAGNSHDKARMLPYIRKLIKFNVDIYAIKGTDIFVANVFIGNVILLMRLSGTGIMNIRNSNGKSLVFTNLRPK